MAKLMKLMQDKKKMQQNVEATQEKLQTMRVTGADSSEIVSIETDGQHRCIQVKLSESAQTLERTILEEAIQSAINSTHEQIQQLSQQEFSQIAEDIQRDTDSD